MSSSDLLNVDTQLENEKAVEKLKEVKAEAKEKARTMTEDNAKLASQLLHLQRQSANVTSGNLAAKELSLQEALDREAQLKKEVETLKDDVLKVCLNTAPNRLIIS